MADPLIALQALVARVEQELALARENAGTVIVDQGSVGRLSRMDALQQQAMTQSSIQRLLTQQRRVQAALDRYAAGRWGLCCECGLGIDQGRLAADPAVVFCLACQGGRGGA